MEWVNMGLKKRAADALFSDGTGVTQKDVHINKASFYIHGWTS